MPKDVIQADYDALKDIFQNFQSHADTIERLLDQLENAVFDLETGGWIGRGASAFYDEMENLVMPAMRRLSAGLIDASNATSRIADYFRQAEEDAARLFEGKSAAPIHYDLRGDSVFGIATNVIGGLTTISPRDYLRSRVNRALNMINGSNAGSDLRGELQNQNIRLLFPDGQTFGSTQANARVITVVFDDLHWAGGQYVGDNHTLTISTSRPFMPSSTQQFARIIAHETQHALDYERGLYGGEAFTINDVNTVRNDAEYYLRRQVETEIRAHAREFAIRDRANYSEHNLFTPQAYDFIWNERGYSKQFEREVNDELGGFFTVRATYSIHGGWNIQVRDNR